MVLATLVPFGDAWSPCPVPLLQFKSGGAGACAPRTATPVLGGLHMQRDGMWKRIGRVAKDKVSGAKGWVDDGASTNKDVNVRGAASGAVIGVRRYICLACLPGHVSLMFR